MTPELTAIVALAFVAVAVQSSVGFGSGLIFVPAALTLSISNPPLKSTLVDPAIWNRTLVTTVAVPA